jgi:elongation factor G
MKGIQVEKIRNIGLFAHGGAGKTTLGEAMLFNGGEASRLGSVAQGNSILDYDPDEIERKVSINLSLAYFSLKDHWVNIVDTPGSADFLGDMYSALRVVDGGVILVDATSGVEVGTDRAFQYCKKQNQPVILFVNKMLKENSDFYRCFEMARESFGIQVVPLQIPIGSSINFSGVVDVLDMKAYTYKGGKKEVGDVPEELKGKAEEYKEKLVEAVAETDDTLTEKYLEEGTLSEEEIQKGLRNGSRSGKIIPILCGDALTNMGIDLLSDSILEFMPSPVDGSEIIGSGKDGGEEKRERKSDGNLTVFVFKTTVEPHVGELSYIRVLSGILSPGTDVWNSTREINEKVNQIFLLKGKDRKEIDTLPTGGFGALVKLKGTHTGDTLTVKSNPICLEGIDFPAPVTSIAVVPKTKGDEEKVSTGLARISEEDPTFSFKFDPELRQTLVYGLGEVHLEMNVSRLKRKFGVEVDLEKPRIPYRETIQRKTEVQGKFKKQTGGRGQFGDVWLRVEPLSRGKGFEFENKIVGGVIPAKYIPSVEKGVREAMGRGLLAGYPVVDFKATLYDGSFHNVDSSDIAFKVAGTMAFKKAQEDANPQLLEPISNVEVFVPEEFMGDIIGDLNSRRGKILGMESAGRNRKVNALVPQAELYKYSSQVRSMTQGRGTFSQSFSHYEEVPREIMERVISEAKEKKEE